MGGPPPRRSSYDAAQNQRLPFPGLSGKSRNPEGRGVEAAAIGEDEGGPLGQSYSGRVNLNMKVPDFV